MKTLNIFILFFASVALLSVAQAQAETPDTTKAPEASETKSAKAKTESVILGGGCFWCVEAVFEKIDGVTSAVSGYEGGYTKNPTYKDICTGTSGHAEVVKITYDPKKVSYDKLLDWFWKSHDPTTLNQQGADRGTQYRSVIFYQSDEEKKAALASKKKANASKMYDDLIVTEISAHTTFFIAEKYHQDYFELNPNQGYCRVVINPKMKKLFKADAKKATAE